MRTRVIVLLVLLAVGALIWTELSSLSPVQGWAARLRDDIDSRFRRAEWRDPCRGSGWVQIDLDVTVVPIPDCYDSITTEPLGTADGSANLVVAFDSAVPDVILTVAAHALAIERIGNVKHLAAVRECNILKDGDPMVWSCDDLSRTILVDQRLLNINMSVPDYAPPGGREAVIQQLDALVLEYLRTVHEGTAPANNRLKLTVTSLACARAAPAA